MTAEDHVSHDRSASKPSCSIISTACTRATPTSSAPSFDPTADLRWVEKGELQVLTVPDWLDRVRKRPPPRPRASRARISSSRSTVRTNDRLHQGALPVAAALFHRLSGGDETCRRLEDRLEILSLRSARIVAARLSAPVALTRPAFPANWGAEGFRPWKPKFQIFLILLALLAGPRCWRGKSTSRRPSCCCWPASRSPLCRACRARTAARTGAAGGAAAADLFGQRRHELARIQGQPAADLLLSVGCVIFTACAVATATHYLIGLPWSVGFLLGAIVAPPTWWRRWRLPAGCACRAASSSSSRAKASPTTPPR